MGRHVDILPIARRMLELGFVFAPTNAKKEPLGKWKAWQDSATRPTHEELLERCHYYNHRSNGIALIHGETNNTICIDFDDEAGWKAALEDFPDAPWKVTSGRGGHIIFRPDPSLDQRLIAAALGFEMLLPSGRWVLVDIKPHGSMSTAPGSWHFDRKRHYKEVDVWTPRHGLSPILMAAQRLRKPGKPGETTIGERATPAPPPRPRPAKPRAAPSGREWTPLERARKYVDGVPGVAEGGRANQAFFLACRLTRGFDLAEDDALDILEEWNQRNSPPLDGDTIAKTITSARANGKEPIGGMLDCERPIRERSKRPDPVPPREPGSGNRGFSSRELVPGTGSVNQVTRPRKSSRSQECLTSRCRIRMHAYGRENYLHVWPEKARLAKRFRKVGLCCAMHQSSECTCHGPQYHSMRPCDDILFCTNCANREANLLEEFVKAEWSEKVAHIRVTAPVDGDRKLLRALKKKAFDFIKGTLARKTGHLPRYFEGSSGIEFFWPECDIEYVEAVFTKESLAAVPEMSMPAIIAREAAAKIAADAWYAPHLYFLKNLADTTLDDLRDWDWHAQIRWHRTGGGQDACSLLPVTDIERARKKRNAEWKKEHPGLERDQCPEVIGTENGKPVFCGRKMPTTLMHGPTGVVLAKKLGFFREDEEHRHLNGSDCEDKYLAASGYLTFSVAEDLDEVFKNSDPP